MKSIILEEFRKRMDERTEEEKKQNPYVYVIQIINEQFGLKETVNKVSFYDA